MFIIALLAVGLHLGWALALWNAPVIHTVGLSPFYAVLDSSRQVAVLLLIVSILPVVARVCRWRWLFFAALIPQQATLMMSAWSAVFCILESHYADAVIRPRSFIAADQWGNIMPAILHTVYVIWVFINCTNTRKPNGDPSCDWKDCPVRRPVKAMLQT